MNKSGAKAEPAAMEKEWLRQQAHALFDSLRANLRDYFNADEIDRILKSIVIRQDGYSVNLSLNVELSELSPDEKRIIIAALGYAPNVREWSIFKERITEAWLRNYPAKANTVLPTQLPAPPQVGERLLLLILSKEERANIPGDLAEEYVEIAAKHTERYAKLWYYKQVAASAWPLIRKSTKWGLLASIVDWIRRI